MVVIVLFLLGTASLALALHAFVTYPLSLLALKAWQQRRLAPSKWSRPLVMQRVALCTYASGAVDLSEAKLRNLLAIAAARPQVQLMVVVDGEAPELLQRLEPHRGHIDVHASPIRRGKSHGMNMLANRTRADLLVFADAAVLLDEQLPARLDAHFADRAVGCVCAAPEQRRLDGWIKALESDTGSTLGVDGSLFAVRAALYHPAPPHAPHAMYVSLMVLCGGHRVVCAADLVAQQDTVSRRILAIRARRDMARRAQRALHLHRLVRTMLWRLDALSVYKYVSHKLLRWCSVYLLTAACSCFVVAAALSA